MTRFQQFWARIVRANPGFGKPDDTKVTMTIAAMRKLVSKGHLDGFNSGMETAKTLEGLGKQSDVDDVFTTFLRKGGRI